MEMWFRVSLSTLLLGDVRKRRLRSTTQKQALTKKGLTGVEFRSIQIKANGSESSIGKFKTEQGMDF